MENNPGTLLQPRHDDEPEEAGHPLVAPSEQAQRKVVQPATTGIPVSSPNVTTHVPASSSATVSAPAGIPSPTPDTGGYVPQNTVSYMSQSQLQQKRPRLPIGIYVIVGFNLLGFIAGFLDTSQNSFIYIMLMLVNLLVAICLLLRMETARKVMVGLSVVVLVLSIVLALLLAGLQQRIRQNRSAYNQAVADLERRQLSPTQKQQLTQMQTMLTAQEKQAGKVISFTYIKLAITAVESVAVVVYLRRPKIKEVFATSALPN